MFMHDAYGYWSGISLSYRHYIPPGWQCWNKNHKSFSCCGKVLLAAVYCTRIKCTLHAFICNTLAQHLHKNSPRLIRVINRTLLKAPPKAGRKCKCQYTPSSLVQMAYCRLGSREQTSFSLNQNSSPFIEDTPFQIVTCKIRAILLLSVVVVVVVVVVVLVIVVVAVYFLTM